MKAPAKRLNRRHSGQLRTSVLLVFLIFTTVPDALWAATYFVSPVKNTTDNFEISGSIKALVESAVSDNGGTLADKAKGSDFKIKTRLIRLGTAYVLSVKRYVTGGKLRNSTKLKASSVEDLDEVVDRAVRAVMSDRVASKDLQVGEVKPQDEAVLQRRVRNKRTRYFGFGPAGFANLEGEGSIAYIATFGLNWEVNPKSSIRAQILGAFGKESSLYTALDLGLHYHFSGADAAPFVKFGLGAGYADSIKRSSSSGFAGSFGLGYKLFRTSDINMELLLDYAAVFDDNADGVPGVYSFRLGLLF